MPWYYTDILFWIAAALFTFALICGVINLTGAVLVPWWRVWRIRWTWRKSNRW